jgi:hypothetical protein
MSREDGYAILSELAKSAGQGVGWDANTKNVSVGGQTYTPDQLTGMGGKMEGGRWVMPTSQANNIITDAKNKNASNVHVADVMGTYDKGLAGQMQSANADLQNNYKNELAQLELAFSEAINSGAMSVREAEMDFAKQKEAILQRSYQDSERSALYGQEMGIQNSQQMMGMMASDNQRTNSMMNENVMSRDTRIANLKDKLNSLGHEKNVRSGMLLSNLNAGTAKLAGDAMFNRANTEMGLKNDEWKRLESQKYQTSERLGGQEFQKDIQKTQFSNDLHKMAVENGYNVEGMRMQFDNQVKLEGIRMSNDITKINLSNANAKEMLALETENWMKKIGFENTEKYKYMLKENATNTINDIKAYEREAQRKLDQFTPGTTEYKAMKAEIEFTKQEMANQKMLDALFDVQVHNELSKNGIDLNLATQATPKKPFEAMIDSYVADFMAGKTLFTASKNAKETYMGSFGSNRNEIIASKEALTKYLDSLSGTKIETQLKDQGVTKKDFIDTLYKMINEAPDANTIMNTIGGGLILKANEYK